MSGFADLVGPEGIVLGVVADSKEALLDRLATLAAAATGLPGAAINEALRTRETLGTTGFGQGAAIPHAKLTGLQAVTVIVARLVGGVAWGALDGEPVDIAVLLLSPAGAGADHLKALARISRLLRDPSLLAALRAAEGSDAVRRVIGPVPQARAA